MENKKDAKAYGKGKKQREKIVEKMTNKWGKIFEKKA